MAAAPLPPESAAVPGADAAPVAGDGADPTLDGSLAPVSALAPPGGVATEVAPGSAEGDGGAGADLAETLPPPPRKGRRRRRLLEWVVLVVIALLVATGLRTFVFQAFFVPSGSMLPTLQIGDRIVVIKVGYTIQRGDIIVFRRPPADTDTQDADLVKRVIGLPGETISSIGNTVLIDGKPLAEPWLPPLRGVCAENSLNIQKMVIPANNYYVLGDCRGFSEDSRYWGTVDSSLIVGKVEFIVWRHGHPYFHFF